MHYHDFKRVFVDKSLSLKDWTAARGNDKISTTVKGITAETWRRSRKLSEPVQSVAGAKTFAEFQTYWAENYNVRVSDELKNLDFKAVQEAAEGIELMLKRFPSAIPLLTEFRVRADANIMSTSYWGQIAFNPMDFNNRENLNSLAKALVADGFYPKGTGIRQYGMHEVVHVLEIFLIGKYGGNFSQWKSHTRASQIVISAYDKLKTKSNDDIFKFRRAISTHAVRYNASECLADAVVDYMTNLDEAAPLSKEIWKIFEEEFK